MHFAYNIYDAVEHKANSMKYEKQRNKQKKLHNVRRIDLLKGGIMITDVILRNN